MPVDKELSVDGVNLEWSVDQRDRDECQQIHDWVRAG